MTISKCIKRDSKKLKKVENYLTYSEEQRQIGYDNIQRKARIIKKWTKKGSMFYLKIDKRFKHKLQGSNGSLESSLMKVQFW